VSDTELLNKIRDRIKARGARGIMGLGRIFKIYDDNGDGHLDLEEAKKAFAELRLSVTDEERHRAF
jgi:Ca2+-binding EF-hand superfamily protein